MCADGLIIYFIFSPNIHEHVNYMSIYAATDLDAEFSADFSTNQGQRISADFSTNQGHVTFLADFSTNQGHVTFLADFSADPGHCV